jgi:hypothetical protein
MTRRKSEIIETLSVTQFLRFGIACCYAAIGWGVTE